MLEKKAKKTRILLWTMLAVLGIVFVVCIIFYGSNRQNVTDESFWREYNDENNFMETLINTKTTNLDQAYVSNYIKENSEQLEGIKEQYPLNYYFIYGIAALKEDNAGKAYSYFKEGLSAVNLSYYSTLTDGSDYTVGATGKKVSTFSENYQKMAARIYFEAARMAINGGAEKVGEDYIELFHECLDNKVNADYRVELDCEISYDVMELDGGAPKSLEIMQEAAEIAQEYQYKDMQTVLMVLADSYIANEQLAMFVSTSLDALSIAETNKDKYSQIMINSSIGISYMDEADYDKAREYLIAAYDIDLDKEELNAALKNYVACSLAEVDIKEGNVEAAKYYIDQAKDWYKVEAGDEKEDDLANLLKVEAEYEIKVGDPSAALKDLNQAIEIFNSSDNFSYTNFDIEVYSNFGDANLALEDYAQALEYYKKTRSLCAKRQIEGERYYLEGMYKAYLNLNSQGQANKCCSDYIAYLKKQIYNSQTEQAVYMTEQFESNKKDTEIDNLKTRNRLDIFVGIVLSVIIGIVIIIAAISSRRRKEITRLNDQLKQLSERDGLTGLYNRRQLDKLMEEGWENMLEASEELTVAMVDIDFFKQYNDTYGHQKGDDVIEKIAAIFKEYVPEEVKTYTDGFASRYGGEEFLIVLPTVYGEKARRLLEDIRLRVLELKIPHEKSRVSAFVTISIGFTCVEKEMLKGALKNYEMAISMADSALYEAKCTRNTVKEF